jgi:hypothetical protein
MTILFTIKSEMKRIEIKLIKNDVKMKIKLYDIFKLLEF